MESRSFLIFMLVVLSIQSSCDASFTGSSISPLPMVPISGEVVDRAQPSASVRIFVCPQDDCAGRLVDLINSSQDAVCAFYAISDPRVVEVVRHGRVPLVLDDTAGGKDVRFQDVVFGPEGHTMHDKFCVLDGEQVVTGSFNPTKNRNHDLVVVIDSRVLAGLYKEEYLEMRGDVFGGGAQTKDIMIPTLNGSLTAYFCPDDPCEDLVSDEIDRSKSSVFFQAFSFTSDRIAKSLIDAKARGVDIIGMSEKSQESRYSQVSRLKADGIAVVVHDDRWLLHRKLFIIDNSTIITGSANPTKSGYYANDENIVIIHDPVIAQGLLSSLKSEADF